MGYEICTSMLPESEGAAIRATMPMKELPGFFGGAFGELAEAVAKAGTTVLGPPFARFYSVKPEAVDVEVVMETSGKVPAGGRVHPIHLASHEAAIVRHDGPYQGMEPAYAAISEWMKEHHREPCEPPREVYLTDPAAEPNPAKWVTLVEQPLA